MRRVLGIAAVAGLVAIGCGATESGPVSVGLVTPRGQDIAEPAAPQTDPASQPATGTAQASPDGDDPAAATSASADTSAGTGVQPADTSGQDPESIPGNDTPSNDTPSNDTPSNDTPSNDTPSNDTPSNDTPSNDTPSNDTPSNDTPGGDTTPGFGGMTLARDPQPALAGGTTPEAYFTEVIPWMFPESDGAADDAASECLVDAFLGSFSTERLDALSTESAAVELALGFPVGLINDDEAETLVAAMEPCALMAYDEFIGTDSAFDISEMLGAADGIGAASPGLAAVFETGMVLCMADLAAQDEFTGLLVQSRLFTNPGAGAELVSLVLGVCAETLVIPAMAESIAVESGVDRDAAHCAVSRVYPSLQDALSIPPEDAEAALMTFGFEMLLALTEC